jgi:hypothetical protein
VLACNFPGFSDEAAQSTTTLEPEPGLTIVFPTATPAQSEPVTITVTPTSTPEIEEACTLRAAFVDDVTIPDDTVIDKGASFTKTWRIRNSGTCRWDTGTTIGYFSGDKLGKGEAVAMPVTEPGADIEISVEMEAPLEPGTYRSNWQLVAPDGARFGGVFYVKIVVEQGVTPTPTGEASNPPQHFIGKTAVDCKQVSFTWEDGTGEQIYRLSGSTLSAQLDANTTTYVWNNPPIGSSVITLTAEGAEGSALGTLRTRVNVNCDAARPNLVVKAMRFDPEVPVAYLPLTMTVEIENDGAVDSGAFVTRWYKVTTLPVSSCEWYTNEGLEAGESIQLACQLDPYSSVNDFVIRGSVDATQAIVESDEVDNTADKIVTVVAPSIAYHFVDEAPTATWTAGPSTQTLTWPGVDTDTQGFVRWFKGEMENGAVIADPCLQTHPKWTANGWVQGVYTTMLTEGYTVGAGDLFYADLAFLQDALHGDVVYKVAIQPENGNLQWMIDTPHSFGDGIQTIQTDLTPFSGQNAYFILRVEAGSSADYDWACWLAPVIYRYP